MGIKKTQPCSRCKKKKDDNATLCEVCKVTCKYCKKLYTLHDKCSLCGILIHTDKYPDSIGRWSKNNNNVCEECVQNYKERYGEFSMEAVQIHADIVAISNRIHNARELLEKNKIQQEKFDEIIYVANKEKEELKAIL